jgi:hypothetical protein
MKKTLFWLLVIYWEIADKLSFVRMFFGSRLRLFWYRLWIRKDEFHQSLNIDSEVMLTMNSKQRQNYMDDLNRRRNVAHMREC